MGYQAYKDRQNYIQELQSKQLDTRPQNESLYSLGSMHRIGLVHGSETEQSDPQILKVIDTTSMASTLCVGSELHTQITRQEEKQSQEKPVLFQWQKSISFADNDLPTIIEFMIANSELIIPNLPNTPLYSAIVLANSFVNHLSHNVSHMTHSMILGNYRQLGNLRTIGAPLLSHDPSIHQLESDNPYQALWNYATINPWATSKFRHGAESDKYQYALKQLRRDLECNLRVGDNKMVIAGKIPNIYYQNLHQHLKATAIATAIAHNIIYKNQTPITILADSKPWQEFIEQFSQMHNIDPANMEVYYDQAARKHFSNLITS